MGIGKTIIDFIFGKDPDIFDEKGNVSHKLPKKDGMLGIIEQKTIHNTIGETTPVSLELKKLNNNKEGFL